MQNKNALICGISGQDGSYLAKLLLSKGYKVYGTSRDAQTSSFENLKKLNILNDVENLSMSITDFRSVLQVFAQVRPDEVYNLAGQSSVGLSFEQPVETLHSITFGVLNILEVVRTLNFPVRLYNAASSECFGDLGIGVAACINTPFKPVSPYAVAKSAAFWEVSSYRNAYGLYACSGILFNHESPLRPERFVTKKIISAACRISKGSNEKLKLGDLSISRDWGWAPDYVNAMWLMLQQDNPKDFVIGTGESYTLREFVEFTFQYLGLDWEKFVEIDNSLHRPAEINYSIADTSHTESELNWKASYNMKDVIKNMVDIKMGEE